MSRRIALLVEGDGDVKAIPLLIRRCNAYLQNYTVTIASSPIKVGDPISAIKSERFIKYFTYAISLSEVDAVLICLDCDDGCPMIVANKIYDRINSIALSFRKSVAVCLFDREYESMFLADIIEMSSARPEISIGNFIESDWAKFRDAKGSFSRLLANIVYKETRDQEKYTAAINIKTARKKYRGLDHFLNVLLWVASRENSQNFIYRN